MADSSTPLIQLKGLRRVYLMGETTVRALDGVDYTIERGEFIMLMGSSGSGKSTMMHILGCLDRPDEGQVLFEGEDVANRNDLYRSALRNHRIGFVFQQFHLLGHLNVLENIALPLSYAGVVNRFERAEVLARRFGMGDRLNHKPSELSGGQRQRVAIARALVNNPDLLLADEPTGNLDSKTGDEIMQVLRELHLEGMTILMVTHDPRWEKFGTRKSVMGDGRLQLDEVQARPWSAEPRAPRELHHALSPMDLVRMGLREGLFAHKLRSALTMLGIIIGVASVIAMSSFSMGSKQKQMDQIRALGANMVRIQDQHFENEKMLEARAAGSAGLSLVDLRLLKERIEGIVNICASREIKLSATTMGRSLNPRTVGIHGDYAGVNNLKLRAGQFISEDDHDRGSRVAVIGAGVARRMGKEMAVGETIVLSGEPYRVIGVMSDRGSDLGEMEATGAHDPDEDMLIPLQSLIARTKFLELRNEIDEIQIQVDSEERLVTAGLMIKRALLAAHGGVEDFKVVIPVELLKHRQQSGRLLDVLTLCISSISLVVGGIGIMNIMLASVTERLREIGLRRAVGATRSDIRLQFLAESVILSSTGGAAGVGIALMVLAFMTQLLELPFVVSWGTTLVAFAASSLTGILFGWYPAEHASSKDPVEMLRYE